MLRTKPVADPEAENPTIALMGDVDLMRQVDLLTEENDRLGQELKKLRSDQEADDDRAAIDGRKGTLQ